MLKKNILNIISLIPGLKDRLKYLYFYLNSFLFDKGIDYESQFSVKCINNLEEDSESFFGYYDNYPDNKSQTHIIFHRTRSDTKKSPKINNKKIEIVLMELSSKKEIILETNAFNWQQGSKLQWISDDKFVFNYCYNNNYQSKIYNIFGELVKTFDYPVYDSYKNKFFLSLNFKTLAELRPDYGYFAHSNINNDENAISITYYESGQSEKLIDINDLKKINPKLSFDKSRHKINHIMISPCGNKFIFMHRWITKNKKRFDRLCCFYFDSKEIKVLSDYDMVSHYCWIDSENILSYMNNKNYDPGYYKVNTNNGKIGNLSNVLDKFPDGHPSYKGGKVIFDTYPMKNRMQNLYIYDYEQDDVTKIGSFRHGLKFWNESRCDLHPRWSERPNILYIDSIFSGKRQLYEININND